MASPSSEANGVAPPSEDNSAASSHSETPPPPPPPRYVFGFSTGHVGTTSLSSRRYVTPNDITFVTQVLVVPSLSY